MSHAARCVCGHLRTAHLAPDADCRACPVSDPCEGWHPEPARSATTTEERP